VEHHARRRRVPSVGAVAHWREGGREGGRKICELECTELIKARDFLCSPSLPPSHPPSLLTNRMPHVKAMNAQLVSSSRDRAEQQFGHLFPLTEPVAQHLDLGAGATGGGVGGGREGGREGGQGGGGRRREAETDAEVVFELFWREGNKSEKRRC